MSGQKHSWVLKGNLSNFKHSWAWCHGAVSTCEHSLELKRNHSLVDIAADTRLVKICCTFWLNFLPDSVRSTRICWDICWKYQQNRISLYIGINLSLICSKSVEFKWWNSVGNKFLKFSFWWMLLISLNLVFFNLLNLQEGILSEMSSSNFQSGESCIFPLIWCFFNLLNLHTKYVLQISSSNFQSGESYLFPIIWHFSIEV